MTTKYIEIDRAIETALLLLEEGEDEQTLAYNAALVAFIKNMENVPAADVVAVVRCRECRYREKEQPGMVYCPNIVGGWVGEDWFCAGGEKEWI